VLGCRLKDLAGGGGVADPGLLADAEHRRQVERIGAPGEKLLELPVDAQPPKGGGDAAKQPAKPAGADRAGLVGGVPADERWGLAVLGQRARR
jgi:hypothetical protein